MRSLAFVLPVAIGLSAALGALESCSPSLDKPAPAGDSKGSSGFVGGEVDADDTGASNVEGGGGPLPDAGSLCTTLEAGPIVMDMNVADTIAPAVGGVVDPGTYVLTAHNQYTGAGGASGPNGFLTQDTLAFDGTNYQELKIVGGSDTDAGTDASTDAGTVGRWAGSYTFIATTFTRKASCGIAPIPVSYSIIGGTTLKLSFVNEEFVFTKQ
jgi:hypothetical protein